LVNVFEIFLPQLLRYPNPADPLNGDAAALYMRNPELFNARVKSSIKKYASKEFSFDDDEDEDEVAQEEVEEGLESDGYMVTSEPPVDAQQNVI